MTEDKEDSWERYKKKMDDWPFGLIDKAVFGTLIFFAWIAFMVFLVEVNAPSWLGGLVFLGGIIFIVKSLGVYDT